MTDNVKAEITAANEERKQIEKDLDKSKDGFAKYIIADQENIRNYLAHPYVPTKKDVRKKKRLEFINKFKKALGL